uniref:Uncharacterized protein n=1 Tax=Tanacetum cinerariifolium TaxID=118510 RepID=A0A6L2P688_TANCI|nr:hypothetical protein [Tanacetum cinerariifolium]
MIHIECRKKEKGRDQNNNNNNNYPYKVIEVTPPPRNLGVRCFPTNLQCGDGVTIEGQNYTISAVTHRSSAEANYRCMAYATCQIAANPLFHEKIKHFEIDVYLIREKVAFGVIETIKISS